MTIPLKEFKIVFIINLFSSLLIYLTKDYFIFPYFLQIVLIVLASTTFYLLYKQTNLKIAISIYLLVGLYGLFIETLSIKTGFPYSSFEYSDLMGYKIADIVPYTVFLVWPTLVISSYSISGQITSKKINKIMVTTILLLLLDLVFDPVATKLGFWFWDNSGLYYGVPFLNFVGWIFSGLISSLIVFILIGERMLNNRYFGLIYLGNLLLWTYLSIKFFMFLPVIISVLIFTILIKKYRLVK